MDSADYGTRKIACPTLALWGSQSHVGRHYKPAEAWAEWAEDLTGIAIPTGHYPAEHRPDLVYPILWQFFSGEPVAVPVSG